MIISQFFQQVTRTCLYNLKIINLGFDFNCKTQANEIFVNNLKNQDNLLLLLDFRLELQAFHCDHNQSILIFRIQIARLLLHSPIVSLLNFTHSFLSSISQFANLFSRKHKIHPFQF